MINHTHYYWYSVLHVYSIKNRVTIERNTTSSVQMVLEGFTSILQATRRVIERLRTNIINISVSTQVSQTNKPTDYYTRWLP